ncbi:MAG: MFS transporter [Proteobacteria bacterium]|nr:MFS transporter [Pseudomonadota bacterium]
MEATTSRPGAVLAIVIASYVMIVLDVSIVITGLPKIQQGLQFSTAGLSWVHNAYTLAFGGFLLLGARAGDILGRRRMFIAGLALFTATSVAIGLAPSAAWLIAARALQGLGAAILAPSTLALLTSHFPEGPQRTRALAYHASAAGVGASTGLVLGGIIADWLSWRVGFFINLPLGIALMLGARRYLKESARHAGRFDVAGAVSSTLGMGTLVYGIVHAATAGWGDPQTLAALTSGIALLTFLVVHEGRAAQPIMPLHLFARRERSAAYAARVLFLGAMVGFWFFTTQFLQGVLGYSPLEAGLAFLPTMLPNFFAALLVPRLTQKIGNSRLLATGLFLALAGMAWLSQASTDTPYLAGVALPMVLIGIGQGFSLSPLTVAAMAGVAAKDAGAASGIVNAAHQLGGSLGLGVLVVVFASAGAGLTDTHALLAHRLATTFATSATMLGLCLALVLALIVRPSLRPAIQPCHIK